MESLKNLCESVVREHVHEYHHPSCLQLLQHLHATLGDSQSPPIQRLLELVDANGYLAVTSGLFCQLGVQLVSLIVQRDTLDADEMTLFTMLIKWSKSVCRRRSFSVTVENQRAVLQGILKHIRFTTVSLHDFGIMMRACQILRDDEITRIVLSVDRTALPYNTQPRTLTHKQIYLLGGCVNGSDSASVRTYSLDRGCQLTQINMNVPRTWHCAAYCRSNKRMMVVGGESSYAADTAETCTVTDPTPVFTAIPFLLKQPRFGAACICIGSRVYITGGLWSVSCVCYDMEQGTWTDVQSLEYIVHDACCVLYEDADKTTILLLGGIRSDTGLRLDTVLQYWPDGNQWKDRADLRLPNAICHSSAVNWRGSVVIVGGEVIGYRASNTCYSLDTVTKQWVSMPPLKTARCWHQAVVLDGKIVAIGGWTGYGGTVLNSVEVFDGEKWTDAQPLDAPIDRFAALVT